MINVNDFFLGLDDKVINHIISALNGEITLDISEQTMNKIIDNSTRVFRRSVPEDLEEFEEESEFNQYLLHWVGGLNTKEYIKVFK